MPPHSLLERTLDDSANRRSLLPEACLITDELLRTAARIVQGLRVNEDGLKRNLAKYAPFRGRRAYPHGAWQKRSRSPGDARPPAPIGHGCLERSPGRPTQPLTRSDCQRQAAARIPVCDIIAQA